MEVPRTLRSIKWLNEIIQLVSVQKVKFQVFVWYLYVYLCFHNTLIIRIDHILFKYLSWKFNLRTKSPSVLFVRPWNNELSLSINMFECISNFKTSSFVFIKIFPTYLQIIIIIILFTFRSLSIVLKYTVRFCFPFNFSFLFVLHRVEPRGELFSYYHPLLTSV